MRRRFAESLSLIDCSGLDEEAINRLPEVEALVLIGEIYDADEKLKMLNADERKMRRDKEVRPLVDDYFQYIESLDINDPSMSERLKMLSTIPKIRKNASASFCQTGIYRKIMDLSSGQ